MRDPSAAPRISTGDNRAEANLSGLHPFVSPANFCEGIGLGQHLDFAFGDELEGLVQILAAVLLAAQHPDASHDQVADRQRQRLWLEAHDDQPPVRT
jgi:hypothetical protein